jgi:DNA (cytosine-5)-methyltransferase 1
MRYSDLFCGIGGFRFAAQQAFAQRSIESSCVFSSDIDPYCQDAYQANFGERPAGDITRIDANEIPDHDLLLGGFPCQAFSICGDRKGFEDTRGTLFFDIVRILDAKRPRAFVLENVKQLATHDNGTTMQVISETLCGLGYSVQHRVLNALDFGLPQKRERTFIVGFNEPLKFSWAGGNRRMTPLEEILLPDEQIPEFYWASEKIRRQRLERFESDLPERRTIWHENKGGHISAYPFSCAMRAGASYNYLLVDGKRRLTEREMLRLQGFPETFQIVCGYGATRRQAGNSVAVPVVASVIGSVLDALERREFLPQSHAIEVRQLPLDWDEDAGVLSAA